LPALHGWHAGRLVVRAQYESHSASQLRSARLRWAWDRPPWCAQLFPSGRCSSVPPHRRS